MSTQACMFARAAKVSAPLFLAAGLAMVLAAGGCSSSNKLDAKASELRGNPSPELATLYQRETDIDNATTISFDENLRMMREDWARLWLVDRPTRLSPAPVPR